MERQKRIRKLENPYYKQIIGLMYEQEIQETEEFKKWEGVSKIAIRVQKQKA